MPSAVTAKQLAVLQLIYQSTKEAGFPPTMTELRDALGVASNQSVLNFLQALERRGYIRRVEGQARSITILADGLAALGKEPLVPFAGESSAGSYIEPSRVSSGWVALPAGAVEHRVRRGSSELFAIQIYGDSMIEAGINDRDIVLVRKQSVYRSGDIVLAQQPAGTTVKRFLVAQGRKKWLQPENKNYRRLPCTSETTFDGKVIFNLTSGLPLM